MYVQPYCRNGSIHNSTFLNGKLLLVKMQCDRRPNAMFKINRWAQVYFEGGNDKMVASFDDFQEMFHCMYAWTGANVTVDNGVRFPKNLTGFFVSADSLKDWLMEMDEMMHWRTSYASDEFEKLPTAPSLRVHLPQDMQITLSIDDDLKCDIAIANEEPGESFIFDFPPPMSRQMLVMALEPTGKSIGNLMIGGNTWPYKAAFDAMNIPFQYQTDSRGRKIIVRLITNMDFAQTKDIQDQLQEILSKVEESPVVLRLEQSEHPPELFVEALKAAESFSFVRIEK